MRVLLTGAGGNLGGEVLPRLLEAGHEVRAFDLDTKATRNALRSYEGRVDIHWGDITNAADCAKAVAGVDVILHNAAITPPVSETKPELAERVNVGGTKNLLDAARAQPKPPKFLFTSSIAVFGITQPQLPPPRRASDPLQATDNYSRHKIACEKLVRESGLAWCIMRIGVSPPINPQGGDPALLSFMFERSLDSRTEYVHPSDVGLAQANAVVSDEAWNKVLLIGGGARCQITNRQLINGMFERLGIGALPDRAFAPTMLYGDWLDTEESQRILRFQHHTFDDHLNTLADSLGFRRFGVALVRPFVRRFLLRYSNPYNTAQRR